LNERFVEIVQEQNKLGRANLVIGHLVGEADLLDHIRPSDRAIFLLVAMDSEICNGGISQWSSNFTGTYWEETIAELEQHGANDAASVLRKAVSLFPDAQPHDDLDARSRQLSAMNHEKHARFLQLDDEYWPLRTDLYERLKQSLSE
jgi:Domain of unknown function (DUF4375)